MRTLNDHHSDLFRKFIFAPLPPPLYHQSLLSFLPFALQLVNKLNNHKKGAKNSLFLHYCVGKIHDTVWGFFVSFLAFKFLFLLFPNQAMIDLFIQSYFWLCPGM
jgi:hypothetical protein